MRILFNSSFGVQIKICCYALAISGFNLYLNESLSCKNGIHIPKMPIMCHQYQLTTDAVKTSNFILSRIIHLLLLIKIKVSNKTNVLDFYNSHSEQLIKQAE